MSIASRIADIRQRMDAAARTAGRDPAAITLVAVSKTHPAAAVEEARAAGIIHFGENRVQEAAAKFPPLRATPPGFTLHLIGPLQTNKVRQAVSLVDVIHTVDRPRLAEALNDEFTRSGRRLDCFIQVNVGREPQKAGVLPEAADAFIDACRTQHGLPVTGLMCIPPAEGDPRPHFAMLRTMAARHALPSLSMGMTQDFEQAIAEGATHVRIGSAIFGSR
jgi:pyridoxal phosphate enzyme (YggS family)